MKSEFLMDLRRIEQQLTDANTKTKAFEFFKITKLEALKAGCDLPVLRRGSRRLLVTYSSMLLLKKANLGLFTENIHECI